MFFFHFIFPFTDFSSKHFTRLDRVHVDLDIIIKYHGRSFFAASLAEAIFDDELFRIAIKISICDETLLNKRRKSLSTWASFTDFDGKWIHAIDYRDRGSKGKLKLKNLIYYIHQNFYNITILNKYLYGVKLLCMNELTTNFMIAISSYFISSRLQRIIFSLFKQYLYCQMFHRDFHNKIDHRMPHMSKNQSYHHRYWRGLKFEYSL